MLYIQQQRYVIMKTHMEVKPKARKWWNKDCLKGMKSNRLFFHNFEKKSLGHPCYGEAYKCYQDSKLRSCGT